MKSFRRSCPTIPKSPADWFWSSKIASCPMPIEEHLGIRHESPQAIVISRGNPIWHASHFQVTAKALEDAIALQRDPGLESMPNQPHR